MILTTTVAMNQTKIPLCAVRFHVECQQNENMWNKFIFGALSKRFKVRINVVVSVCSCLLIQNPCIVVVLSRNSAVGITSVSLADGSVITIMTAVTGLMKADAVSFVIKLNFRSL